MPRVSFSLVQSVSILNMARLHLYSSSLFVPKQLSVLLRDACCTISLFFAVSPSELSLPLQALYVSHPPCTSTSLQQIFANESTQRQRSSVS
ncbi:hypothetical protein Scep_026073 [Stephania cephalantha]|uniref:Uncharacterized protein n=1 Tax=Stephania cephalantha TaxID=152367 RepID=A0AAP0HQ00_9MAGN